MSIKLGNIEDIVMKRVISAGDSVVCVDIEGASRSKLVVGCVYKVESVVGKGDMDDQVGRIKLCGISDWSFRPERFKLVGDKEPSVVDFVKVDGISEFIILNQLYYNKDKDMWDSNLMGEELDGQLDWIRGAWHMFKESQ